MYPTDPPTPPPQGENPDAPGTPSQWFGRRKRVAAREVGSAPPSAHAPHPADIVAGEMHAAAAGSLHPTDLIEHPPPPPALVDPLVVDPTSISVRHRKAGHNLVYRLAQAMLVASFIGGALSIAAVFNGDHAPAFWIALGACALSVSAAVIVRSTRLAYRLRGYAVAAIVCAAVALVFTFVPMPAHDDESPVPATPNAPTTRRYVPPATR